MSALVLHRGARRVEREELALVPTPEPTATWFPVSHISVLDTSLERLREAGYVVRKSEYALNKANTQFFGVLDLESEIAEGVSLAVGLRSSTDQTFPLGFAAGNRTFVCDNLAFAAELVVKKKHTKQGQLRFANAISQAVASLPAFQAQEAARIQRMAATDIDSERAESIILRAYLRDIVSFRHLQPIAEQWNRPAFDEWGGPTLWRLYNAMTYVMADVAQSNPNGYANRTIRLNQLLNPYGSSDPTPAIAA